jgi:hypothetical protein
MTSGVVMTSRTDRVGLHVVGHVDCTPEAYDYCAFHAALHYVGDTASLDPWALHLIAGPRRLNGSACGAAELRSDLG